MLMQWFDTAPLPLALLITLGCLLLIHLGWYLLLFVRLALHKPPTGTGTPDGVSVVICAHNEAPKLRVNLPLILEQDHPAFEVVVVDHGSDDDTSFLLQDLAGVYPQLKSLAIREDLNFFSGKKFPLSIGIRSAHYPTVLLTDADCRPASPQWIRKMQAGFTPGREIVLGYSPYSRARGLLNRLIRFDTAHIAIQYLSYALAGIPYMGVGRNLSYKKELFFRNKGFIRHYRIRSGDDDLFINRVANRKNVSVVVDPEAFTFSEPKPDFGKWITQKRRHLSTGGHYRLLHRILLGGYAINPLLFYALAAVMLALNWSVWPVAALILIRLLVQYLVFAGCLRRLKEKDLILLTPFFEIFLLLLNIMILLSNQFSRPSKWK